MSNHSELRDSSSEVTHFKNKYKFSILKSTMLPQIKVAFVWSQRKYKIYITISIRFLFWCLVCRHCIFKKMASLICVQYFNFRFNACVLTTLIICDKLFILIFWRSLFVSWVKTTIHSNICCQIWNVFGETIENFWTWNNSMLMKYLTDGSAEWIRIIWV
jgi:hypothetical protein